jgi:hypothetical protein
MGWWFGRKAAEPLRAFVPAWLQGEGEAGGFARGYEAQLDEVYRRNPVGLRSVRLVAGLVGALPLYVRDGNAKSVELVQAGGLMERAAAALLLHGNAYVRLAVDGHDRPAELHLLRPERVSVACGEDGWPLAYLYRAGGQVTRVPRSDPLGRRQVAHLKALNPGDDQYGLGCLDAACPAASVHNRARQQVDMLLCPVVEGAPSAAPPASPVAGACYLVGSGATGAWAGQDGAIACLTDGGWRFVAATEGVQLIDRSSGQIMVRQASSWEIGIVRAQEVRINGQIVLRERQPAVADPAGGTVIDSQCRAAVGAILGALRTHGLIG